MTFAIYLGIVVDLEGLGISVALRAWQSDVPTILHAIALRRRAFNSPLQGV